MTANPLSIAADTTVREAATFLTEKGFSAAPVIDEAGRPVGVLSQSDLIIHDRENLKILSTTPPYYARTDLSQRSAKELPTDIVVDVDCTPVRDIMTPVIFSVAPESAAFKVIEDMLAHKIHRLFVVDGSGILLGVISTVDVLRHLHLE
jgi:CBS domain-containing protein